MSDPLTMDEAVRLAELPFRDDLVPISAQWIGIGWVVHHQSRQYLRTRHFLDRVLGGPSLVLNDRTCVALGSRRPWQVAVVELARARNLSDRLEAWVIEQAEIFFGDQGT